MKYLLITVLFLFGFSSFCQTQQTDSVHINTVKKQGSIMAKLFLDKNYKEFVKFIYQPSIDIIGGKEMAIQLIEKAVDKLASDGFQITNCAIKKPEFIIHYKNELQCTVIQYLVMKSSKRMFYSKSTLIGFSKNNGESWTFFETSGKDLKTLQSTFKDLSDSLTISEETQSVFFKK